MKKIKWVKKIERISDSGDVKESIYKPEKGSRTNYSDSQRT